MAGRLNTILVVLSVPTLLSAAISIYWSRKRKSASTESTSESTSEATTESTSEATGELTTESSPHPLSHQVQCETDSSSSTPAPVTEQPAFDPPLIDPDSQSEVQERVSEADNCDNSVMQISDAVNPTSEAQVAPVPSNCATPPMASRLQRANGAAADGPVPDLSAKVEKDVIPKSKNKKQHQQQPSQQTDTGSKKNGSGKKGKNVTSGQSPASDAQSPPAAGGLPDSRSRQTHDSGGSVGAASLDSGTDVSSPASAADQKSSDRSVDSPGLFKSDASQGSPCNWVASDSHSEVICHFLPSLINCFFGTGF